MACQLAFAYHFILKIITSVTAELKCVLFWLADRGAKYNAFGSGESRGGDGEG